MFRAAKAAIVTIFFCVVLQGCVAPGAIKAEIQGVRNDMGQLEKIVDQKADNSVVAEKIDEVNNNIEQVAQIAEELSLWRTNVKAKTINYGGGGWIVLGTGIIVLIFVGAGFLFIRAFIKRGNSLSLLTCAIQKVGKYSPASVTNIKAQLKKEIQEGQFKEKDRQNLGKFAKKIGTFTEQK
jgi:hypothetical protein